MSLLNRHCLLVSFLVVCLSIIINVASVLGNKMENPDDLTQSLHKLNDALVPFDQATLVAPKSIKSLTKGLVIFGDTAPANIPVDPVYNAQTAADQASNSFHRGMDALVRWSASGTTVYDKLERLGSRLSDDQFYSNIESVITKGHSDFNQALGSIHTVITQLQDIQTNLNKINIQAKDIKKDTDFVEMVSFVLQLAQEDSQVGHDLTAELKKAGLIPMTVQKSGVSTSIVTSLRGETVKLDPVVKSKIIQAYLNVFKKTLGDSVQSLSKLKVDQSQLAAAPQGGQISTYAEISTGGDQGQQVAEGGDARKVVFEAFGQLEKAMEVFKKHCLPEDA